MKKFSILLLSMLIATVCTGYGQTQSSGDKFNLGFEKVTGAMPDGWDAFGSELYAVSADTMNVHSGGYSAFMGCEDSAQSDFKALGMTIPGSYAGKQITLTGWIKTENVSDGFAGLWMRIDPEVAFDNMGNRGITGTTDWKQYKVTLNLDPEATDRIVVGGILSGKGKMWVDDLKVTIDGRDISALTPLNPENITRTSGIDEIMLNKENRVALYELGLIWGFLKYYHPAVAAGKYDWDKELFNIIPQVIGAKNKSKRHSVFVEWIDSLGDFAVADGQVAAGGEVKISPDLGWIESSGFPKKLVSSLEKVKNAKRKNSSYYVGLGYGVGNPEFKNEKTYGYMQYPDAGMQLLSLYRYWNMIQYYFPYKNLIDEDWKGVLKEFVPTFVNAESKTDYMLAVLEIIARVNDTHANIWSYHPELEAYRGMNRPAPVITFVEGKAVVTGFYDKTLGEKTGLQIGDIITEAAGGKVDDVVNAMLSITPASNYPTKLRDIAGNLLRTNGNSIAVSYLRDGKLSETVLEAYAPDVMLPYHPKDVNEAAYKLMEGNIGYLYPARLKPNEIASLWDSIKDTDGLIIDLRCYPSDFIVFTLGSRLVPQPTPFVKFSAGSITTPGLFTMTPSLSVGENNPGYYKGKVVIMVNETTQSNAEYTTMALRTAPRATVLGSTTAGADGNVSQIMLPGGITTMISGIGIYYPDGTETQRVGIVPDIEMKPTIKGIAEGRDELLEKAVELVK